MMFQKSALALICAAVAATSTLVVNGYSFTARPAGPRIATPKLVTTTSYKYSSPHNGGAYASLKMISTGDDRSERQSLDISKTQYTALVKAPKDAYIAFAEKGKSNAK